MINHHWKLPPIDKILDPPNQYSVQSLRYSAATIEDILSALGIETKVREINQGPRFTRFGLQPGLKVQSSTIRRVQLDLSVALYGSPVAITDATPQHPFLSLIVDNNHMPDVKLRNVLDTPEFKSYEGYLKVGLGLDILGHPVIIDLTQLPHLLIGGSTGTGKSVCLNTIIASLLCTYTPDELKFYMIDLTGTELGKLTGILHLTEPIVHRKDRVINTLNAIEDEISRRYKYFAQAQVRDIVGYHNKPANDTGTNLPYIVVAIDNVVVLMMESGKEVEEIITRMANRARGAGVHLVFSTPRANTDVMAGKIKANFPGRVAFKVPDQHESQLILDVGGAQDLLGPGDMLLKTPGTNFLERLQCVRLGEHELDKLVEFWMSQ
jgi:S-DNA-T family DNA segregation ATPase FtsK/SpoIIIE